MTGAEISIQSIEAVLIDSELISSGGGNYYRNKINFHLKLAEELSPSEVESFSTELQGREGKWEVRLLKGSPERKLLAPTGESTKHLVLEEEVDMALEDFTQMNYEFPLARGQAQVSFKIQNGKVQPEIRQQ